MSLVQLTDVLAEAPALVIADDTTPTTTQAEAIIANVEAEVRALVTAYAGTYPTDAATDAARFIKATVIARCLEKILRARYALVSSDGQSPEIDRAAAEYTEHIRLLPKVALGMARVTTADKGRSAPSLAAERGSPRLAGSFDAWTAAKDADSRAAYDRSGRVFRR